ncbi:MAG: Uma2 family endonuclease, partial [Dolichospermum sp.]
KRLDLTIDPPPDLALEIDITSRTHLNIYQGLKVPEVWRFENGILQINVLQDGVYVESKSSLNFPDLPLIAVIPQYLEKSRTIGRNATLKAFRSCVNSL